MDSVKSNSVFRPSEPEQGTHPHACIDGWVTLGQIVVDPETGEEVEEYVLYLCRKCAERS